MAFTNLQALNELETLLRRSFPQYMAFARPYAPKGKQAALEVFADIAADQNELAERAAALLDELEVAPVDPGFPMEFTDSHDLSIDYLQRLAARHQTADIARLRELAETPGLSQTVRMLIQECVGMARAHLEMLQCAATS